MEVLHYSTLNTIMQSKYEANSTQFLSYLFICTLVCAKGSIPGGSLQRISLQTHWEE